jgi:hypothetical protein
MDIPVGLSGARFEVFSGPSENVNNIARAIYQKPCGGKALKNDGVGKNLNIFKTSVLRFNINGRFSFSVKGTWKIQRLRRPACCGAFVNF